MKCIMEKRVNLQTDKKAKTKVVLYDKMTGIQTKQK